MHKYFREIDEFTCQSCGLIVNKLVLLNVKTVILKKHPHIYNYLQNKKTHAINLSP